MVITSDIPALKNSGSMCKPSKQNFLWQNA